ncbi:radical SAM protein [candidate division WOR-3 bacterium]|nr:radical SAM protein [candidate division WOR-3 bacterium]
MDALKLNTKKEVYKPSNYNYLYKSKDGSIQLLYNTFTGALAEISDTDKEYVSTLLRTPNNPELRNRKQDIFAIMVKSGFLVKESMDELDFIRLRYLKGVASHRDLSLVLLPSRACNFNCIYCFEKEVNEYMSKEDCKNILKFTKMQIKEIDPRAVLIRWYGGEPLLRFDIIRDLCEEFIKICLNSKCEYYSDIITNGYLLDESTAKELVRLGIKNIQITLDGPEEVHNKRRMLKNGGPTFKRIKESIIIAKRYFDSVAIRINSDRENMDAIPDLLEEEWLYGENTELSAGILRSFTGTCNEWLPGGIGFTSGEFFELFKMVEKKSKKDKDKSESKSIPVKSHYCGAQLLNIYSIGPNSLVYKCTSRLDPEDAVGIIKEGRFYPNEKFVEWLVKPSFEVEPCRSCKFLPNCMGGCLSVRKECKNTEELRVAICDYALTWLDAALEEKTRKLKRVEKLPLRGKKEAFL